LGALFLASLLHTGVHGAVIFQERSFFGVHRVTEAEGFRKIVHGNTIHGQQSLAEPGRPQGYYFRDGPLGQLLYALEGDARPRRVGLVGLGAGGIASYAAAGQHWTYFEIDPVVATIARDTGLFSYLRDAGRRGGTIDIVLGDARLSLQRSQERFGMLIVDAFGSDAIPIHLLTRQAMQVYLNHLEEKGILVFHISNRYLDLEPVLANLADDTRPKLSCWIRRDLRPPSDGSLPSIWMVLARPEAQIDEIALRALFQPARRRGGLAVWTDDFSNIWSVFRWREERP
jgi:spermidine synthase